MFTNKEQLIKRTGKNSIGRYDFLKLLATEFQTTKSRGKFVLQRWVSWSLITNVDVTNSFFLQKQRNRY